MANAALDTGGAVGANYDAAMRLVEISANPEMLKGKLEELRKQEFAAKAEMDKLTQEKADFKLARQDLQAREGVLIQGLENLGKGEAKLSTRKNALDQETSDRNQAAQTERQRLKDAAASLKRRETEVMAAQKDIATEKKSAQALAKKGQALKAEYEAKIGLLRDIVCD